MITLNSMKYIQGKDRWDFQFKGESTDTKPVYIFMGNKICPNSYFFEQDTGNFYYYNETATEEINDTIDTWTEIEAFGITAHKSENYSLVLTANFVVVRWNGEEYYCPKVVTMDDTYFAPEGSTPQNFKFVLYRVLADTWSIIVPSEQNVSVVVSTVSGEWSLIGDTEA